MRTEVIRILILTLNELFSEKLPRVLPGDSFLSEYTVAQERVEYVSSYSKTPICRQ